MSATCDESKREPKFTVRWRKLGVPEDGLLECQGLTARTLVKRLRGAVRNSGPVVVEAVELEAAPARGLLMKDGTRRLLSDEELRRVTCPKTSEDWALRLSLRKSQRPRLLPG